MHPKQIPIIITSSMLLMLVIVTVIAAAYLDWYMLVVGGAFITGLIGIMIGRYVPKPFDAGINAVVMELRTLVSKLDLLHERMDTTPLAVQEWTHSLGKIEHALAIILRAGGLDGSSSESP